MPEDPHDPPSLFFMFTVLIPTAAVRQEMAAMKSILIIDDDEFILFGLSKAISMHSNDSEILTAHHGKTGP